MIWGLIPAVGMTRVTLPVAIASLLAEPPFAALHVQGLPLLVGQAAPFRLIWANAACLALFGVSDEAALLEHLTQASDPGSKRLRDLSGLLSPGAAPRLERLRFFKDAQAQMLTFVCQRLASPQPYFIAGALDGMPIRPETTPPHSAQLPSPQIETMAASSSAAPPAAPTHASLSFADLQASFEKLFPSARRLRFVWQLDDKGALIQIGGVLSQIIGVDVTQWLGQDFARLMRDQGLSSCEALHQAIADRRTLSGLDLHWPIQTSQAAIAMTLGGVPSFDAKRQYEGFRGFGVIHLDQLIELTPSQSEQAKDQPAAQAQISNHMVEPERELSQASTSNVVRLRHFQSGAKSNGAAAQSKAATPSPSDQLSLQERNAFREIARALGAKIEADDLSSAPAKLEQDVPLPKAEASPPPTIPSEETKREEVDKSLAKIRDFIEVTLADADAEANALSAPTQTCIKSLPEETPHSLKPIAHHEFAAQTNDLTNDQTQDPLSLEANAKALLERLPFGVLVTRGAVPIIMNQSLLDTLGYSDIDAFYEAGGPDHIFEAKSIPPGEEMTSSAIPVRRADGHILQLDVRLRMMQWGGDAATLMTFHPALEPDLVKKIRALEHESGKLQSESRELHAILDTATDGVVVLDAQGLILSLNQSAQALFGYDQGELLGQSFSTLLMPESHADAQDYLAGLQGKGVASLLNDGREIIGRARQGGAIPIFMTIGRVASGEAMKFCAVLRDMTHWKKAESELREARREAERASALKSDFLAKISHEIRTPLHAIMGFAEVIMEERFGPVGNDRYKDYLKDIHASGTHVMSLVNDLLDLSKIESGKAELNFVAVDANRIVQDCVALLQPQALRERVILRVALAPHMPKLVADERSLKQIVLNLLSNAVKFNEPGGQVIVSTALTDSGNAVIRVKDTGIGMDDEEIQMALEPFRQLATAKQSSGTGLGLPLTRALVEANRASFTIRSRKREGTLVEVSFPSPRVLAE